MPHPRAPHAVPRQPAFAESGTGRSDKAAPDWGGILWPAFWINVPDGSNGPQDGQYRLDFTLPQPAAARIYVSGDQRYDLALNGERVGRGPHPGDPNGWCYEAYDLDLPAGDHVLSAWVSSPGAKNHLSPAGQLELEPGFLLAAESPLSDTLSTGRADWRCRRVTGVTHLPPTIHTARLAGGTQRFDAREMNWTDDPNDPVAGWGPADVGRAAQSGGAAYGELGGFRSLVSSRLPAMMDRRFRAGVVRGVADESAEKTAPPPYARSTRPTPTPSPGAPCCTTTRRYSHPRAANAPRAHRSGRLLLRLPPPDP